MPRKEVIALEATVTKVERLSYPDGFIDLALDQIAGPGEKAVKLTVRMPAGQAVPHFNGTVIVAIWEETP